MPQSGDSSNALPSRRLQRILLALVVLGVALLRVRLLDVPLERDEGDYAYGAQLLLQGLLPYRDFYTMRMPGIYAVYSLPLALLGHSAASIHFALLVVHAATIALLFVTGRKLFGPVVGLLCAAFYAALSLGGFTLGLTANSEHFVVFLAACAVAVLALGAERPGVPRVLLAGVLLGSCVVVKHIGSFFVAFGALLVLATSPRPLSRAAAARLLVFALGAALPIALVCLAFVALGLWESFRFWAFEYAGVYASSVPADQGVARLLRAAGLFLPSAPLVWGLALLGLAWLPWDRSLRPRSWLLLAFAALASAAVSSGLYFRAHYFILLFPAVSLLAAIGARSLARVAVGRSREALAAGLIGVVATAYVLVYERQPLFRDSPTLVSAKRYGPNPFPESLEVARYLAERTGPGDRILVLGSEPQIYFYAGRNSVTPHMHMYPLMESHPYARAMQQQLIRDAEAARPEFIVVVHVSMSWLSHPGSPRRLFDWMYDYVRRDYARVGLVEIDRAGGSRYYWDEDSEGRKAPSAGVLQIFRRVPPAAPDAGPR